MKLSDHTLRGRNVIAADGLSLGSVATIFIDGNKWTVEELRVTLHNDIADRLGIARSWRHPGTVEVPTRMIQSVADAVILAVGLDEIKESLPKKTETAPQPQG